MRLNQSSKPRCCAGSARHCVGGPHLHPQAHPRGKLFSCLPSCEMDGAPQCHSSAFCCQVVRLSLARLTAVPSQNEGNRAQPRGRLHCSEAHPSRTARGQDAAEIAAHVHVPASEFFFSYLKERYGCHEVAMFVAHSILKVLDDRSRQPWHSLRSSLAVACKPVSVQQIYPAHVHVAQACRAAC